MHKYNCRKNIFIAIMAFFVFSIFAIAIVSVNALAENEKLESIKSVMLNERDSDSSVQFIGLADEARVGKGNYNFADDLYEYTYSSQGYIIMATRTRDKTLDIYNAISENTSSLELRALELHKRNLAEWLRGSSSVTKAYNERNGVSTIEVVELVNGNPSGLKTTLRFTKEGALISFVSIKNMVSDELLYKDDIISKEKAEQIALDDLLNNYREVLDITNVKYSTIKESINQRIIWTVTISTMRSDLDTLVKSWGAMIRVDNQTGEIIQRAYTP